MFRVTAVWSGFPGGPGFSNFYFTQPAITGPSAQAVATDVRAFFAGFSGLIPAGVAIQVAPQVALIDEATGTLQDEITVATPPAVLNGGGNGERSAPSGAVVNWKTSTIVAGRRLRGKTFLVPLTIQSYDNTGTLTDAALALLRASAATLATVNVGAPTELCVWHRPVNGAGGSLGIVTSSSVPDKAAILTSRRD
jgi:hypothetical protein